MKRLALALSLAALIGSQVISSQVLASAPAPGTPEQVAALVAAAPSITKLPSGLTPSVADAPKDQPVTYWPKLSSCVTSSVSGPPCVFGDIHGSKTIVLFGDSHAYMWFGALEAIAKAAKWRLVALLNFGCPVADVTVWNVATNTPDTACPTWRKAMIKRINRLDPALVVMSEAFAPEDAQQHPITDRQWTEALERSLASLDSRQTKKVLIGNTVPIPDPISCLAANPDSVQTCSIVSTSPKWAEDWETWSAQRHAEQTAAAASKVPYVNEVPWECSATCTVVIGTMIAYDSSGHLSNTYAVYLSKVLRRALAPSM